MILIDTNVYSALERGQTSAVETMKADEVLALPIFVIAELKYGFLGGNNRQKNELRLERFMAYESTRVLTPSQKTADVYAELASYARKRGCALANNDLWIVSIAKEYDCTFVTYDKDFEVFQDIFGDKLIILHDYR